MRTLKEIEAAGVGWCDEVEFGRVFDRVRELEARVQEAREIVEELATQDCESWGCEHIDDPCRNFPDHDCPPERARAWLKGGE